MAWSIEQVVAIAPNPARFAAADAIAAPARWVALGADDAAVWGRCRGSGREPYETMVDHAHVAWRCTCPSRSQPCKHALALLIMWVKGQVPEAPAPAGVRSWADGHARREPAGGAPAGDGTPAPQPPPDDDASDSEPDGQPDLERRRDEHVARLQAGLVELDRWLDDRLRTGLADPTLARYATWDDLAARLVDARAGALANRVRRLAGVVGARPDWHEVVLAELGVLHLLAEAGQRVPELPGRLADSVATACGWQVRQADVLAGVPDTDTWVVAGRSDTREDRIEVRRTWLRGQSSGHWAMVLSFAAYRQSLDTSLVVGDAFTADLHRYPGPSWRAIIGARLEEGVTHPVVPPVAPDVAAASAEVGTALAGEPWLDRVPVTLVATPAFDGGRWVLTDDTGAVALAPDATGLPMLLAASAGRPVTVTVEWTIDGAVPLTVHLADRALDIGPRADLSFVDAGMSASSSLTDHWHELVTVALLGTDRRDPPAPPPGPLADVVDDTVAATPSARMLAAVGGCVAARRAGVRPLAPAPPPVAPDPDDRPLVTATAARRWWSIARGWPVLEDEWLAVVERTGQRLPPDVLVGLLRRHRTDGTRRALVLRMAGAVGPWLLEHQPALRSTTPLRQPPAVGDPLPGLAVPPELLVLLDAGPDVVVRAVVAGFRSGTFGIPHRAVLINFIARARTDTLLPLASALAAGELPYSTAGLAASLAELAATRAHMLEELTP